MTDTPKPRSGRITLPRQVRDTEADYVAQRRRAAGVDPKAPRVGLALSGGGIRSATFCLGVLQTLARRGTLRLADHVCTVSGGGYIGSCLTSLMNHRSAGPAWPESDFDLGPQMPLLRADQVHHLRKHGDFVMVRRGLFRRETLRVFGSILLGLACTVTGFVAVLAAVAVVLLGLGEWLGGATLWSSIREQPWRGAEALIALLRPPLVPTLLAAVAGFGFHILARETRAGPIAASAGETGEDRAERRELVRYAKGLAVVGFAPTFGLALGRLLAAGGSPLSWIVVLILVSTALVVGWHLPRRVSRPWARHLRSIRNRPTLVAFVAVTGALATVALAITSVSAADPWPHSTTPLWAIPLGSFAGAVLAAAILQLHGASEPRATDWSRRRRSTSGARLGIGLSFLVGWSLCVALLGGLWWLRDATLPALTTSLVAFVATRVLARRGDAADEPTGWRAKLQTIGPRVALKVAVPVFLVTAVLTLAVFVLEHPAAGWPVSAVLLVAGAAVLWFVDFNRVSPHYFYRDRLAETYLMTERVEHLGLRLVRDDAELALVDLNDHSAAQPNPTPYHLVLCALNMPGSRDLARRTRKSDHFVLSRDFCGSTTTGFTPTSSYDRICDDQNKLGRAMTISGAAAASSMGFYTTFSQAFATTLFNVRLGHWMPNPRFCRDNTLHEATGSSATERRRPVCWPALLWRELTASSDARGRWINLSDGGHTGDNVGIYPLLQRRADLIIAVDSERDPDSAFPSLASAIRQIYTDENVAVDIDLASLRSQDPDKPRRPFVIGRIRYPDCRADQPNDPEATPKTGWLLVLKSVLLEGEPAVVRSYADRQEDFPHQTTMDQFFDDDQFEAYRALGEHVAAVALDATGVHAEVDAGNAGPDAETLIHRCRELFDGGATVPAPQGAVPAGASDQQEAARVRTELENHEWNKTRAAKALGISRSTLARRMKQYDIRPA